MCYDKETGARHFIREWEEGMKRIVAGVSNLSILWKFTFIYFLLIVVPLAVVQVNGYRKSVDSIREQNFNILAQTLSQIKQNVLYMVKNCEYASDILSYDEQIQGFLGNPFDTLEYLEYDVEEKLSKISQVGSQHFSLYFYTSNTTIPEMDNVIYALERIENKDYYRELEALAGNSMWGGIRQREYYYGNEIRRGDKRLYLPLYTKIKSLVVNNKVLGILEIDLPLDEIMSSFAHVEIGANGYLAVLDKTGAMVYNGGDFDFRALLSKESLVENKGITFFEYEGRRCHVVYDTVEDTGLKLLAVITEDEFVEQISSYKLSLNAILVLGGFFAFFVTYLVTRYLFKRITVLLEMMKRVEKGDFDTRVEEKRQDEIGKLAHGFNNMTEKLEEILLQLIEKETAQWEAELRALQAQITPHFLYNTLESLKMECEINGQFEIADALTSLGNLFRYNIKWDSRLVTLSQEMEHVRNYITVMKIRYGDQIEFTAHIPEGSMGLTVPKMILQPVVENCFYHSYSPGEELFRIEIQAQIRENTVTLLIRDNGPGIDEKRLNDINTLLHKRERHREETISSITAQSGGIGLVNVNRRIKMQFGESYGVSLESEPGQGTEVRLTLPAVKFQN